MRVLLGGTRDYKLIDEIKKNLEFYGFEVTDISLDIHYKYKNITEKLVNTYHKTFLNSLQYKAEKRLKAQIPDLENILENKTFDFALFIRPDYYPIHFIASLRNQCKKMMAYQWDGIHRFPEVKKYINYFDKFYVFDPKDLDQNTFPATNFYFDYHLSIPKINSKEVYFLGRYSENRMKFVPEMLEKIEQAGFQSKFLIFNPKNKTKYFHPKIKQIESISFDENLKNIQEAEVLVDFFNFEHNGLSFRTFEAIGYRKKLITNNPNVKFYDFYHENNFFIWNNNLEELETFLNKPFVDFSPEIIQKYSFNNWIHYIFDLQPNISIKLPTQYLL